MPGRYLKFSDNLVVSNVVSGRTLGDANDLLKSKLRECFNLEAEVIFARNGLKRASESHVYLVKVNGQLVATIDGYYGGVLHLETTDGFIGDEEFMLKFHKAVYESLGVLNFAYDARMSMYNPQLGKVTTVVRKLESGVMEDG